MHTWPGWPYMTEPLQQQLLCRVSPNGHTIKKLGAMLNRPSPTHLTELLQCQHRPVELGGKCLSMYQRKTHGKGYGLCRVPHRKHTAKGLVFVVCPAHATHRKGDAGCRVPSPHNTWKRDGTRGRLDVVVSRQTS
jgi:hypothetical protein